MTSILTPYEIAQLTGYGVTVNLEGDTLAVSLPENLSPEAKGLLRELKAREREAVCHLTWQSMLERCNQSYRPGALEWARQHFPELEKPLVEAESRFEAAYWRQDIEGVRQAAEIWEATIKRICLLYEFASNGGSVLSKTEKPF